MHLTTEFSLWAALSPPGRQQWSHTQVEGIPLRPFMPSLGEGCDTDRAHNRDCGCKQMELSPHLPQPTLTQLRGPPVHRSWGCPAVAGKALRGLVSHSLLSPFLKEQDTGTLLVIIPDIHAIGEHSALLLTLFSIFDPTFMHHNPDCPPHWVIVRIEWKSAFLINFKAPSKHRLFMLFYGHQSAQKIPRGR